MIKEEVKTREDIKENKDNKREEKNKKPFKPRWELICKKSFSVEFTEGKVYQASKLVKRYGKFLIRVKNNQGNYLYLQLGENKFGVFELVVR